MGVQSERPTARAVSGAPFHARRDGNGSPGLGAGLPPGALATVNLAGGPRRAARAHRTATPAVVPARTDLIPSGRTT